MNIQGWFPCYPRDSQESSPAPQLKGINSSALATQPSFWSNSHIHANTIALTIRTFVSIMMSLLLNMLSRFVIAFLPRSKHLLISSFILTQRKIRFFYLELVPVSLSPNSLTESALCLTASNGGMFSWSFLEWSPLQNKSTKARSAAAAAAAKSLQLCPTLWDPIDGSPPGSPVPGILQARTLEWVAISFSNAWKWKVKGKSLSRVRPFETLWTAAHQTSPSMGFSRQEYWSGVPLPSPKEQLTVCQIS